MFIKHRPRAASRLNLALQGGGAHGAFTWGVLDALLERPDIEFDGVSGTSAGAINAVLLAQGLMTGGREGARRALAEFWLALADAAPAGLTQELPEGRGAALAPLSRLMLLWTQHLAPEQFNPLDLNPLRELLAARIDFARLRRESPLRLFIAATQANSGQLRLFRNAELSLEALLASACLPGLHRAVEIAGEPHWDGAYAANPAVFPLFFECEAHDILLVLLTPLRFHAPPQGAAGIRERGLEIAFSAAFLREMRMFALLREQLPPPRWLGFSASALERRIRRGCFHLVEAGDVLGALPGDSKLAASRRFFEHLHALGRARAQAWLAAHRTALGRHSTLDLAAAFT
jgi:NTE family protein